MFNRRGFIRSAVGGISAVSVHHRSWLVPQASGANSYWTEQQSGDPDLPIETLSYDPEKMDASLLRADKMLGIRKNPQKLANQMLKVALGYRGITRDKDPDKVGQFLSLFPIEIRDEEGKLLPFCAAGVSFCACQAYCDLSPSKIGYDDHPSESFKSVLPDINEFYFKPHCSCQQIVDDARTRNIWSPKKARPATGWLVFYDWKGHGVASHVGIVESADQSSLDTIEFNTTDTESGNQSNGGAVAHRSRSYDYVMGFVRTYQV
jgi:hypothetical protein